MHTNNLTRAPNGDCCMSLFTVALLHHTRTVHPKMPAQKYCSVLETANILWHPIVQQTNAGQVGVLPCQQCADHDSNCQKAQISHQQRKETSLGVQWHWMVNLVQMWLAEKQVKLSSGLILSLQRSTRSTMLSQSSTRATTAGRKMAACSSDMERPAAP